MLCLTLWVHYKEGLVDSKDGKHILDPEYSDIRHVGKAEDELLFKVSKEGNVYLYDKNGDMTMELDYEETGMFVINIAII